MQSIRTSSQEELQTEEKSNHLVTYRDLKADTDFFNAGFLAVQPVNIEGKYRSIGLDGFSIGATIQQDKTETDAEDKTDTSVQEDKKGRQLAFFQPNRSSTANLGVQLKKENEKINLSKKILKKETVNPSKKTREFLSKLIQLHENKIYILPKLLKGKLVQFVDSYIFTKKPAELYFVKLNDNIGLEKIDLKDINNAITLEKLEIKDVNKFNNLVKEIGIYDSNYPLQDLVNKQKQINELWEIISANPGHQERKRPPVGLPSRPDKEDIYIYNKARRDEIYVPMTIDKVKKMSFYIHPSVSPKNNAFKHFSGFDTFHTCGCVAGMKGQDRYGNKISLIKHDIEFHPKQKITQVVYNPNEISPYEAMLFAEFEEKTVKFIDQFATPFKPKHLIYHLPYYDYMLFGVRLFSCGRMSFPALDTLCQIMVLKKLEYERKINAICKKHNIQVTITSPFDNIFGPLPKDKRKVAGMVLEKLGLTKTEIDPAKIDKEVQKENEKKLVQYCLNVLKTNSINEDHREVWEDFIKVAGSHTIETLEDLFKIANAVVVGFTSKGAQDHRTCSLLPVTEKQIIISYENYSSLKNSDLKESIKNKNNELKDCMSKLDQSKTEEEIKILTQLKETIEEEIKILTRLEKTIYEKYPAIFNAIMLESLLTYDSTTDGLVFYSDQSPKTMLSLLEKKKLLQKAYQNITLFAEGGETHNLNDLLNNSPPKSPLLREEALEDEAQLNAEAEKAYKNSNLFAVKNPSSDGEDKEKKKLSKTSNISSNIITENHKNDREDQKNTVNLQRN